MSQAGKSTLQSIRAKATEYSQSGKTMYKKQQQTIMTYVTTYLFPFLVIANTAMSGYLVYTKIDSMKKGAKISEIAIYQKYSDYLNKATIANIVVGIFIFANGPKDTSVQYTMATHTVFLNILNMLLFYKWHQMSFGYHVAALFINLWLLWKTVFPMLKG